MSEGGRNTIEANDAVVSAAETRAMKKRIRDLERLLGKKTMEVEILKEAIEITREKTDLAHAIALRGRYPMTRVADAMGVSRSRLVERIGDQPKVRPPRYSKAEDEALLPLIRDIVDDRLTYDSGGFAPCSTAAGLSWASLV